MRDTKNVSDFVQKHFVSATNVSQFAQPKKHHGQQCVLVYQGLKAGFIRRISAVSNAVQTKDNEANLLTILLSQLHSTRQKCDV